MSEPAQTWRAVIQALRNGDPASAAAAARSHPLLAGLAPVAGAEGAVVIGQIGQSLDGRIAAPNGESRYINGPAALDHLHRLRALVDAVVIGAGTALADDPSLTVRRVEGSNPVRVLIDPSGRVGERLAMFGDWAGEVLRVSAGQGGAADGGGIVLPRGDDGRLAPGAILAALAERGLHRILVEGGANTLGAFLAAGRLDRLHVLAGPIILGAGKAGIDLPGIQRLDQALRPQVTCHALDGDFLLDCAF